MTAVRDKRLAVLRELHALQQPQWRCAELMQLHPSRISQLAKNAGLKFSKTWMSRHQRGPLDKDRVDAMAALYRAGYTLEQIGEQYSITRERVRQLLTKFKGMNYADGGLHAKAVAAAARSIFRKNARLIEMYGCTLEQWREVVKYGRDLMAGGSTVNQTPLGAFRNQRGSAKRRGIAWEITFWQWWMVWRESGHWDERGRGQGFVMCRRGDVGPYAVHNVFIERATINSSEGRGKNRDPGLPVGVRRTKSGRFTAMRHINGVAYCLGTHDTPELAHAAYLMAGEQFARAA